MVRGSENRSDTTGRAVPHRESPFPAAVGGRMGRGRPASPGCGVSRIAPIREPERSGRGDQGQGPHPHPIRNCRCLTPSGPLRLAAGDIYALPDRAARHPKPTQWRQWLRKPTGRSTAPALLPHRPHPAHPECHLRAWRIGKSWLDLPKLTFLTVTPGQGCCSSNAKPRFNPGGVGWRGRLDRFSGGWFVVPKALGEVFHAA